MNQYHSPFSTNFNFPANLNSTTAPTTPTTVSATAGIHCIYTKKPPAKRSEYIVIIPMKTQSN